MKSDRRRSAAARGFTIIELVIVSAVIAVLSSIAIPAFTRFTWRTREAERELTVKSLGRAIHDWVDIQSAQTSTFSLTGAANPALPVTPQKKDFVTTQIGWRELSYVPEGTLWHRYSIYVTASATSNPTYTITAQGDVDGDGLISTYIETSEYTGSVWNPEKIIPADSDDY